MEREDAGCLPGRTWSTQRSEEAEAPKTVQSACQPGHPADPATLQSGGSVLPPSRGAWGGTGIQQAIQKDTTSDISKTDCISGFGIPAFHNMLYFPLSIVFLPF